MLLGNQFLHMELWIIGELGLMPLFMKCLHIRLYIAGDAGLMPWVKDLLHIKLRIPGVTGPFPSYTIYTDGTKQYQRVGAIGHLTPCGDQLSPTLCYCSTCSVPPPPSLVLFVHVNSTCIVAPGDSSGQASGLSLYMSYSASGGFGHI